MCGRPRKNWNQNQVNMSQIHKNVKKLVKLVEINCVTFSDNYQKTREMAKIKLCDFLISQNLRMDFHKTPETA